MKSRELPWHKRFPGKHLMAAADLSLEQEGALLRLRDWSWIHGPLPTAPAEVAALAARAPDRAEMVAALLRRFFELTDAGWVDAELEEQRAHAIGKRQSQSQAGRAGASVRWGGKGIANAITNAMADAKDEAWQTPPYARSKISNREDPSEEGSSTTPRARGARLAAGGES